MILGIKFDIGQMHSVEKTVFLFNSNLHELMFPDLIFRNSFLKISNDVIIICLRSIFPHNMFFWIGLFGFVTGLYFNNSAVYVAFGSFLLLVLLTRWLTFQLFKLALKKQGYCGSLEMI